MYTFPVVHATSPTVTDHDVIMYVHIDIKAPATAASADPWNNVHGWANIGIILGHRLRRWPRIISILDECFTGATTLCLSVSDQMFTVGSQFICLLSPSAICDWTGSPLIVRRQFNVKTPKIHFASQTAVAAYFQISSYCRLFAIYLCLLWNLGHTHTSSDAHTAS